MKSVAEKMGIKAGARAFFVGAPPEAIEVMHLPELDVADGLTGAFDYLHLFVKTQKEFREQFPRLKAHLKATGTLWVSWPKNRQLDTDLVLTKVIELGYDFGLVESTALRVDDTWSALKFTHPKAGKLYQNSYGKLKQDEVG